MLKVIQHLCQAAASWRPDWLQSRQDHSSDLQQSYTDRKIFLTPEGVLLHIYWLKRYIQSEMRGCGMWCENLTLKRALFKKSKHHTRVHGIQVKIFFQATMDVDKGCPPKACALQHLPGKHRVRNSSQHLHFADINLMMGSNSRLQDLTNHLRKVQMHAGWRLPWTRANSQGRDPYELCIA